MVLSHGVIIAEEGDDIANLEVPKDDIEQKSQEPKEIKPSTPPPKQPTEQTPKATSPPSHHNIAIKSSKPLFPSVLRLLQENGIEDTGKIKGTGIRGMLTKGDVLAYLGKASSPSGTFKPSTSLPETKQTSVKKEELVWVL